MSIMRARTKRVVLRPALAGTLMTPQEFDSVREVKEGYVYELIHGVLVVSPPPLEAERGPNEELGFMLRFYQRSHPEGHALDDTLPEHHIYFGDNARRADRAIWAGLGRQPDPQRDPPTIAVEFPSRGKRNRHRDYVEKKQEYKAIGIQEYWLIDRFDRIMTVYRSDGSVIVVKENETYTTPLLPGFELPLAHILAVADRWKRPRRRK
jgi:Uma2 family endonuclease